MVTKYIICKKLKHSTLHIFNSSIPFYLLTGICLFSPRGTPDCSQYVSSTKLLCFQELAGLEETSYEANNFHFYPAICFFMEPIFPSVLLKVCTLHWLWYVVPAFTGIISSLTLYDLKFPPSLSYALMHSLYMVHPSTVHPTKKRLFMAIGLMEKSKMVSAII